MISGARPERFTWLRRLVARAQSATLTAFIVPGREVAQMNGLDPAAAGLDLVATPRHARVLLLVGELPAGLASAAAAVYAQMPRPRALLAVGTDNPAPLPEPDVRATFDQADLASAVLALRRRFAAGSFSPEATAFDVDALQTQTEYVCPMHPQIVKSEPGSCPICGMNLVPRETASPAGHPAVAMGHGDGQHEPAPSGAPTYVCPMHPEVVQGEPGSCPICGMNLELVAAAAEPTEIHPPQTGEVTMHHHGPAGAHAAERGSSESDHGSGGAQRSAHGDSMSENGVPGDHAAMTHGASPAAGHGSSEPAGEHNAHAQAQHTGAMSQNHGSHQMGGFMSMVAMTKDLPRSADGLPMEWVDAPFGPLFPGLPGGLALTLTLDGDTVARATVDAGLLKRGVSATWPGAAAGFPDRFARLDPLDVVAYRVLAYQALEAVAGTQADDAEGRRRIAALERERVQSHLAWLAQFAFLLGDRWLMEQATALGLALHQAATMAEMEAMRATVRDFLSRVRRTPLLDHRLRDVGKLTSRASAASTGPVARAGGTAADARSGDIRYRALGYSLLLGDGGDSLSRMRMRLQEIEQSMALVQAAATLDPPAGPQRVPASGSSEAAIETPRGTARLSLQVEDGVVVEARVDAPSSRLLPLIAPLTEGSELADALVGVASLDLSPWELEP